MKSILLTGFMAAGKSYLGCRCAAKLELQFFDTDQLIENTCGNSIKDIFAQDGENAFRETEHKTLKKLITSYPTDAIIAAGGGAASNAKNLSLFKKLTVVFLDIDFAVLKNRLVKQENEKRPLLKNITLRQLKSLFNNRRKVYFALADYVIKSEEDLNALICNMKEEDNKDG